MSLKTKIETQYTTPDTFIRACQFAFNESRDKRYVVDKPCPEEWVILAVYNYYKGCELPISFIRNPISLLDKFKVVDNGEVAEHMRVVETDPTGRKLLIA